LLDLHDMESQIGVIITAGGTVGTIADLNRAGPPWLQGIEADTRTVV
jgi:hypothetical protein